MVDKVIRNGLVAVLYSPDYGAGWSTWVNNDNLAERLLYDPGIVDIVDKYNNREYKDRYERQENNILKSKEIEEYMKVAYKDQYVYTGGAEDLTIEWIPVGARFRIDEYDGSEGVVLLDSENYYIA